MPERYLRICFQSWGRAAGEEEGGARIGSCSSSPPIVGPPWSAEASDVIIISNYCFFICAYWPNNTSKTAKIIFVLYSLFASIVWLEAICIFATPIYNERGFFNVCYVY